MPEKPLLVFPERTLAERAKRPRGGARPKVPDADRQRERLSPQLERLQRAMDDQRLLLQGNPQGLVPEQVLVLETVGDVGDFIGAVRRVGGLEWLVEEALEDLAPGDGFEDREKPEKTLTGKLFLILTDQQALQQLLGLFQRWQAAPEEKWERGLNGWRSVFKHLKTIRPWNVEDRLAETGLIEDWQQRAVEGADTVRFEAELWFRQSAERRDQSENYLREAVRELGGRVVTQSTISEIAYHALLGELPIAAIQAFAEHRDVKLLQCGDVMHFRPVGQCAVRADADLQEANELIRQAAPAPQAEPIMALLDGLPLERHEWLRGLVVIEDPDGFEGAYAGGQRVHGTAMASLICNGELDAPGPVPKRQLYVRPILKPKVAFGGGHLELVPEDTLPVDLIHRAVRRMFEGEGDTGPTAPTVKVINLSVADPYRPFLRSVSAWARLLDWLSWRYNVLFVVSVGNQLASIELPVPRADLGRLTPDQLQAQTICALANDTRNRRIMAPAESINALSVGGLHSDAAPGGPPPRTISAYQRTDLPSPFNAHGLGVRRGIKPEILCPGGRVVFNERLGNAHPNATLDFNTAPVGPGHRVAHPGPAGSLRDTRHTRGTSNAAALATRSAGQLFEMLEELRGNRDDILPTAYDPVLMKTLLAHGAMWNGAYGLFEALLRTQQNSRRFRDYVSRFFGYGPADVARTMECTAQRATVLGFGELSDKRAHVYRLPLPPSLSASREWRRLIITLGWFTPVSTRRQAYRKAQLWFDPANGLAEYRQYADGKAVTRGTLQHEVLEGQAALDFQDGENLVIQVHCREDAEPIDDAVKYGLAVTLEVREGVNLPIYEEIRARLRVPVPVRAAPRT